MTKPTTRPAPLYVLIAPVPEKDGAELSLTAKVSLDQSRVIQAKIGDLNPYHEPDLLAVLDYEKAGFRKQPTAVLPGSVTEAVSLSTTLHYIPLQVSEIHTVFEKSIPFTTEGETPLLSLDKKVSPLKVTETIHHGTSQYCTIDTMLAVRLESCTYTPTTEPACVVKYADFIPYKNALQNTVGYHIDDQLLKLFWATASTQIIFKYIMGIEQCKESAQLREEIGAGSIEEVVLPEHQQVIDSVKNRWGVDDMVIGTKGIPLYVSHHIKFYDTPCAGDCEIYLTGYKKTDDKHPQHIFSFTGCSGNQKVFDFEAVGIIIPNTLVR